MNMYENKLKQYMKVIVIPDFDVEVNNSILYFLSTAVEPLEDVDHITACFNTSRSISDVLFSINTAEYNDTVYNAVLDKICSLIWSKAIAISVNKALFDADEECYCEALTYAIDNLPCNWLDSISVGDARKAMLCHIAA